MANVEISNARAPFGTASYGDDDVAIARELLGGARLPAAREARVDGLARELIEAIRGVGGGLGGVDDLLREYSLSTQEGLALMVLAEALLRVPDAATADDLIEDKLGQGDFAAHHVKSDAILVNASAWALGATVELIRPHETPDGIVAQAAKRLGLPAVRAAMRQAMRVMGNHFVLGQTIDAALRRAQERSGPSWRYSFDMLGEGARTRKDAESYFHSYAEAIDAIGRSAGQGALPHRPGISVKLSALHPRYEAVSRGRVIRELVPQLVDLARKAKSHDLNFTIDAEEADRLELSLDVLAATFADSSLRGWDGFGLAIQACQKRAAKVIAWTDDLARVHDARMMVRLVKGAYWDMEIKRAQERGLDDYPVFTRKAMTDLNYIACAKMLLAARPRLFPQFATHNALTVASIVERAGDPATYEFQRLHGMGDALYDRLVRAVPGIACRTYAPVGGHQDLLAYLVRRLLENGANSSFVSVSADPGVPVEELLRRPADIIGEAAAARHPHIPLPRDLFGAERVNSRGVEPGHAESLAGLLREIEGERARSYAAAPLIGGTARPGNARPVLSPFDETEVGQVTEADASLAADAVAGALGGFPSWSATPAQRRSDCLMRAADLIEARRGRFIHLMQAEGGKTLDDAVSEVREAADFCRYYATQGRALFGAGAVLPGPTGESNTLTLRGRGVFVAISPWNFPLAIFTGQIAAALMAGNSVIAKPAEQTPLIAAEAVALLHEAGIPSSALHLAPGDGKVGAALVADPRIAGVVFTGSTEIARAINRSLAGREGPIVPLIAETGGINAMIVDATALPEQVTDDVITSAFRSAGQRCSALRLLCVQDDVADKVIAMIAGAARELKIGDPREVDTHVGPVIDADAKRNLEAHIARLKGQARVHHAGEAPERGLFVAPHVFELKDAGELKEEIFGPVLHVVRYREERLDDVLAAVAQTGYALTLGVHTRIDSRAERIVARLQTGNVYVNRSMIGAVVGVQPFGGFGLSGTGPKAGGPHYLPRFTTEQTVTVNTAASGGNASLLTQREDG